MKANYGGHQDQSIAARLYIHGKLGFDKLNGYHEKLRKRKPKPSDSEIDENERRQIAKAIAEGLKKTRDGRA